MWIICLIEKKMINLLTNVILDQNVMQLNPTILKSQCRYERLVIQASVQLIFFYIPNKLVHGSSLTIMISHMRKASS